MVLFGAIGRDAAAHLAEFGGGDADLAEKQEIYTGTAAQHGETHECGQHDHCVLIFFYIFKFFIHYYLR